MTQSNDVICSISTSNCVVSLAAPLLSLTVISLMSFVNYKTQSKQQQQKTFDRTQVSKISKHIKANLILSSIAIFLCIAFSVLYIINQVRIIEIIDTLAQALIWIGLLISDIIILKSGYQYSSHNLMQPLFIILFNTSLLADKFIEVGISQNILLSILISISIAFNITNFVIRYQAIKIQKQQKVRMPSLIHYLIDETQIQDSKIKIQETNNQCCKKDRVGTVDSIGSISTRPYSVNDEGQRVSISSSSIINIKESGISTENNNSTIRLQEKQPQKQFEKNIIVDKIYIKDYSIDMKYNKETLVYKVIYQDYSSSKDKNIIKRSYREFQMLYNKMKEDFPQMIFPPFPKKFNTAQSLPEKIIKKRKIELEAVLQYFVEKKMFNQEFTLFLTPQEGDNNAEDTLQLSRQSKRVENNFKSMIPGSLKSMDTTDIFLPEGILRERSSSFFLQKRDPLVFELEGTQTDGDIAYYNIRVITLGTHAYNILKRFNNFKELNKQLQNLFKTCPKLNEESSENLVEKRSVELIVYLNKIAEEEEMRKSEPFIKFIQKQN